MRIPSFVVTALALFAAVPADAGVTLDRVKSSGELTCGININESDYSKDDTHGNLASLGADFCKALAAAVLGDGAKIKVIGYPDEPHGLNAVQSGAVDLLAGATPTVENTIVYGAGFAPPLFRDGQGFLVAKDLGIATLNDLDGKRVCFISGTDTDRKLEASFKALQIKHIAFPFEEQGEMEAALFTGHCQAMTGDLSQLADTRVGMRARAADFTILAETITRDPYAPAYRQGDPEWGAIVTRMVNALIKAEELGVTQANVAAMMGSTDPRVRRFLGPKPGKGGSFGLDGDWVQRAIKAVGNYGEIYARDLGEGSPLKLPRDGGTRSSGGGLIYVTRFR